MYFDNNATTDIDERVLATLQNELADGPFNPSSSHRLGRRAKAKIGSARADIARALGAQADQIIFTSGGTEALNLAIRGALAEKSGHVITSSAEHSCVLNTIKALESSKLSATYLTPDIGGAISQNQLQNSAQGDTLLIALTAANNETGALTDITSIAKWAHSRRIPFVVDAVCAFGKIPISHCEGITALCLGGHKFHGPPGTGVCCLSKTAELAPQITGGAQELGRRAGTENVPAICALARAIDLAVVELESNSRQTSELADLFWSTLKQQLPSVELNGADPRLPNTRNVYFPGVDGQLLLIALDKVGICAGFGAACSSGGAAVSHVLTAMGYTFERAGSSLRFSFGKLNQLEEVKQGAILIATAARRMINRSKSEL